MSDDYKTERVWAGLGTAEFPNGHPMPRRRAYRAYGAATVPTESFSEQDVASIFGLPVGAMSPEMLLVVQKLLSDAANLRSQLDVAQRHRRQLEDQTDHVPGLPCLNGHAFVRELDAFLQDQSAQDGDDWGHLAVLQVCGVEAAIQHWGMAAGEAVLNQIWEIIHGATQAGEPVAYRGFGLFCWLIIGGEAQTRLHNLQANLQNALPVWDQHPVPLTVSAGLAPLLSGQGAVQALDAADRQRIGYD